MGASRVLCCVVNVFGMQHLSWLSFTVEMSFLDHYPQLGYPPLNKESFLYIKRSEAQSKLPLNNVIVYSTIHKRQPVLQDLLKQTSPASHNLLAFIYHTLVEALVKKYVSSWKIVRNSCFPIC